MEGLHIHTGSKFWILCFSTCSRTDVWYNSSNFPDLKFIDFGSGFKVACKEGMWLLTLKNWDQNWRMLQSFANNMEGNLNCGLSLENFWWSETGLLLVRWILWNKPLQLFSLAWIQDKIIWYVRCFTMHITRSWTFPIRGKQNLYSSWIHLWNWITFGWDRKNWMKCEKAMFVFKNAGAYGFSMSNNYTIQVAPGGGFDSDGKGNWSASGSHWMTCWGIRST